MIILLIVLPKDVFAVWYDEESTQILFISFITTFPVEVIWFAYILIFKPYQNNYANKIEVVNTILRLLIQILLIVSANSLQKERYQILNWITFLILPHGIYFVLFLYFYRKICYKERRNKLFRRRFFRTRSASRINQTSGELTFMLTTDSD